MADNLCLCRYRCLLKNEIPWYFEKAPEDEAYHYINLYGKEDVPENAAYAFGKGFERAFSARIYLWSRTIPLLKDYLLLGSGPDTFAALLIFFGRYLAAARRHMAEKNTLPKALLLSVLGYLVMGMANDSVVVAAPVFWAVLGAGYALA